MAHITVGIDQSPSSVRALDWSASAAAAAGCDLEIVHATGTPQSTDRPSQPSPAAIAGSEQTDDDLLSAAARQAARIAPGLWVWTRTEIGSLATALIDASQHAERVVVGSRGPEAFEGFTGSASLTVASQAACPVVVVPDREPDPTPAGPIVVGIDGSDFALAALAFALREARLRKTSVRAVTGCQSPITSAAGHDQAAEMITEAVNSARSQQTSEVAVEARVVHDPAVESIMANAGDAQLIVVGAHGRGFVGTAGLGAVSRQVLYEAGRPVAVVDLPGSAGGWESRSVDPIETNRS